MTIVQGKNGLLYIEDNQTKDYKKIIALEAFTLMSKANWNKPLCWSTKRIM